MNLKLNPTIVALRNEVQHLRVVVPELQAGHDRAILAWRSAETTVHHATSSLIDSKAGVDFEAGVDRSAEYPLETRAVYVASLALWVAYHRVSDAMHTKARAEAALKEALLELAVA